MKSRRSFLLGMTGAALLAALAYPVRLLAAQWNKAAFEARNVDDALKAMGIASVTETAQIRLKVPEIAENGSIVPMEIASDVPDTQAIYIVVDKNTQPLVGSFEFVGEGVAFVATRIKMTESSRVRFIVRAGGAYFGTSREIKVTIGGCGA